MYYLGPHGFRAAKADNRTVCNQGTGWLFYDANGSGVGAASLFAAPRAPRL